MLQIKDLHKSYSGFKVLNGLYMNINKGDVYGFLGKNGCGKTTTMNIVCNIIPKDDGEIILGEGGSGENRVKIGYLPESPSFFGYMNGYEYLGYIAYALKFTGDTNRRIAEVLDITGMTEGAKRRIKGYSRGMNQRLGIAAALFGSPELLILDEPTSALDPEGRAEVISIIRQLTETGCTILLCTHILSDVERVCGKIGILTGGRIAEEGSITDIMNKYGSSSVEIELSGDDGEKLRAVELLKNSGFASNVRYFPSSSLAAADIADPREGMGLTLRLITDNGITVSGVRISKPTLEQIYLDIVGGNRRQW